MSTTEPKNHNFFKLPKIQRDWIIMIMIMVWIFIFGLVDLTYVGMLSGQKKSLKKTKSVNKHYHWIIQPKLDDNFSC